MRLYEYEAKAVLAQTGIDTPKGVVLTQPGQELPGEGLPPLPLVLKSQVLTGGRMKAGAIRFADDLSIAQAQLASLWQVPVNGLLPRAILVEPRLPIVDEYYAAVTYDQLSKLPVLIFSRTGGIDVEENKNAVGKQTFSSIHPFGDYIARQVLLKAGVASRDLAPLTGILNKLVKAFLASDATLLEINPLARLADGSFLALDAHCDMEDDALYRQKGFMGQLGITDTHRPMKPATPFEQEAQAIDSRDHRGVAGRVVEFDGNLGLLIGGGGASLAAFDATRRYGGKPANYCEIGGNPSVAKVADLVRLILSRPGVEKLAVIMNVVNNTRVDLVARGVIKGILSLGLHPAETIAVFRIPGAWEAEGTKILRHYGIEPCDRSVSIDQAAGRSVQAVGGGAR